MLPDPVRVSEGDADESATLAGLSEDELAARMEDMERMELEQVGDGAGRGGARYNWQEWQQVHAWAVDRVPAFTHACMHVLGQEGGPRGAVRCSPPALAPVARTHVCCVRCLALLCAVCRGGVRRWRTCQMCLLWT